MHILQENGYKNGCVVAALGFAPFVCQVEKSLLTVNRDPSVGDLQVHSGVVLEGLVLKMISGPIVVIFLR